MVRLPFKVEEKFHSDPWIGMYQNDDECYCDQGQFYYLLHVEMLASVKAHSNAKISARVVGTPLAHQEEEGDDDMFGDGNGGDDDDDGDNSMAIL